MDTRARHGSGLSVEGLNLMAQRIRQSVASLDAYVPGEQINEPGVVKLNTNENPYPPSPKVAEALAGVGADRLRKYPDPLCTDLRAALADLHGCAPSQVFVGNGSDEVLALCTRAFVENNGGIGYFDPSYSLYTVLADIRAVAGMPTALADDFAWVEPRVDGCSLFFLTCPNAPTGIAYPPESIRTFAAGFPGVVVVDEAYADFATANCIGAALESDNMIVARTFSKSYSLAGLRVGYAVGPGPLIRALFKIKDSYNVDAISQAVALAAVRDPRHMSANAARIIRTREHLSGSLAAMGFDVCPSQANFVWARPFRIGARELFETLRKRRILIRYFAGGRTDAFVRITVGTDDEIEQLLRVIGEIQPAV